MSEKNDSSDAIKSEITTDNDGANDISDRNEKGKEMLQTTTTTTSTTTNTTSASQELTKVVLTSLLDRAIEKAQKPLQQLRQNLPSDRESVRALPFYNTTVNAIAWQRDNYLVGEDYANQRRYERAEYLAPPPLAFMPYDATALGSIQIVNLGAWFIPSKTIHNALLPIVVALPNGILWEPIKSAVTNSIPMAQENLDIVVKNQIISLMHNPFLQDLIKKRTERYTVQTEGSSNPVSNNLSSTNNNNNNALKNSFQ